MAEWTALGLAIEKHWRKYCPKMVRELSKSNQLKQSVLQAQEIAGDLLYELVSVKKMDYHAAWELAMQEALPPEETSSLKPGTKPRKKNMRSRKASARRSSPASPPSRGQAWRGQATKSSRSRRRGSRATSG